MEALYEQSDAIFVGRVVSKTVVPAPRPDFPRQRETETTLEVEELWKGPSEPTLRVRTCGWEDADGAVTCSADFWFKIDSRYLVFAGRSPLHVNTCGPEGYGATDLVSEAQRALEWLHSNRARKPTSEPAK
jgi:hypothetical protein